MIRIVHAYGLRYVFQLRASEWVCIACDEGPEE